MKKTIGTALGASLALLGPGCGGGESPRHDVPTDVTVCKEHMREIYRGLIRHVEMFGGPPRSPGAGFLAELIASGLWEDSPEKLATLNCPGPGAHELPPQTSYADPYAVDETQCTYAVRDTEAHPFSGFPAGGRVPVLACDNAQGMNHDGVMNVLYADGSVRTFVLAELVEAGVLPPTATTIVVGEDSPIEDLRVLRADP